MARKNKREDVFRLCDMQGGDRAKCWLWKGALNDKGLPYISIEGRKYIAYRVSFELVHGPLNDGELPMHSCDTPACVNPWHLQRGTHKTNMEDMKRKHRHGMSFYVVRAIRKLAAEGIPIPDIAKRYGIGVQTARDIVNEVTHKETAHGDVQQETLQQAGEGDKRVSEE